MDKYLSDKLKAISFSLMIMVVYLHSYNLTVRFNGNIGSINNGYNSFFQNFISDGITRVAVPLFFIIAGFLFFFNNRDGQRKIFTRKLKSKFRSLVIPYLFWSLYGILFFVILQAIPFLKTFFTNELIIDYSVSDLLKVIFVKPIPFQLWFIRDLCCLIILSPIIYLLIKKTNYFIIIFFLLTWLMNFEYVIFSNEAVFFFVIGSFLGIYGINIQNIKFRNKYLLFTICWFILVFVKTYLNFIKYGSFVLNTFFHKTSILFGILAVWFLYDKVFKIKDVSKSISYDLFKYSFFLYVFHDPLLSSMKKVFYYILGRSEFSSFIIFITTPILTIFIAIFFGFFLRNNFRKLYDIVTGGR